MVNYYHRIVLFFLLFFFCCCFLFVFLLLFFFFFFFLFVFFFVVVVVVLLLLLFCEVFLFFLVGARVGGEREYFSMKHMLVGGELIMPRQGHSFFFFFFFCIRSFARSRRYQSVREKISEFSTQCLVMAIFIFPHFLPRLSLCQ